MSDIFLSLGSEIVACDDGGLLPYPDEIYFERRVSPETLARISNLFAWGPGEAARFGRFLLINTNFVAVNHRVSSLILENQSTAKRSGADSYHNEIARHKARLRDRGISAGAIRDDLGCIQKAIR